MKDLATQYKRIHAVATWSCKLNSEKRIERIPSLATETLCATLGVDCGALLFVDQSHQELYTPEIRGVTSIRIPIDSGILGKTASVGQTMVFEDITSQSVWTMELDKLIHYTTKSIMCMAVKDEQKTVIGVVFAANKLDGYFNQDDEETMKLICNHLAVAIKNCEMYRSIMSQQHKIKVLLEVAKQMASETDVNRLLSLIMQRSKELLEADRCSLFLLDQDKKELYSMVADNLRNEIRFPIKVGIGGHVATTGLLVNIVDAYEDPRFNKEVDYKTGYRTKSILCVPLRNSKGDIIGVTQVLNKQSREKVFGKDDEELFLAFSAQAGIAIEKVQLYQQSLQVQHYLESVLKSITSFVITLDEHGKLKKANRDVECLFGTGSQDMKDKCYNEWIDPASSLVADIASVYKTSESIQDRQITFSKSSLGKQEKLDSITLKYSIFPIVDSITYGFTAGVGLILEDLTPQKRIMDTLSRYISPALAEQVVKEGGDRLGGIRQQVSILFVDIRGFTSLSESLDASQIVDLLNEYFRNIVSAVEEEKGVLDKYIGDAAMAVFGVPYPEEADPIRACNSALKILDSIGKWNLIRNEKQKPIIDVGIGINTGVVLSGNIGSENRLEYTVIGDAVNLASRIESLTKYYGVQILISEFTWQQVSQLFHTRELDSVRVMGKKSAVRLFEIMDVKSNPIPKKKQEVCELYAMGLDLYKKGKFTEAEEYFLKSVTLLQDKPSKIMRQRCITFAGRPPVDWDGTWEMTSK